MNLATVTVIVAQRGAVVQHRVDEHLRPQVDAFVAAALRDRRGKPSACARPRHGDAVGVDAQFVCTERIHRSVAMQSSSAAGNGCSGASR